MLAALVLFWIKAANTLPVMGDSALRVRRKKVAAD
jgi:hypothetical protein